MWYSVDPLAEKFPGWSPYNYALQNPVRMVDPDGRAPLDWILKNGTWSYNANITTKEQAQSASGVTGFAKNGTIVQTSAGYARLNANNQVDWLPNETAQDKATNTLAVLGQFFGGNSASTWDPQEFPQITNNGGLARSDFDPSSWDKFNSGTDKLFNLDMGSFVQPGKLPDGNSFGERFGAFAEGLKNLFDLGALLNNKQDGFDSLTVKVTSLDSVKYTGFTREKDTTIFYNRNIDGSFDKAHRPVLDSSYNRSIRNFNNHVPERYHLKQK